MVKLVVAVAVLTLLVVLLTPRARAASGIRLLGEPAVENRFPDGLVFTLEAESDAEIREARLRYSFVPDNRSSSAKAEFEPGTKIRATYNLRSGTSQLYIPPGKSLRYSWELVDAAGNELKTDERETAFSDPRFKWQQVTDGIINLNYYRGTQRDAEVMAQVANETILKSADLMGAQFDFPIKIWAYASPRDFQIALAHASVTSDPNVLGQAHAPDTFIMVVDRLSSPSALDTMRHELTHLVTAQALRGGPFKDLYPSWLNEGTSVYMQVSPNDVGYVDALEHAIRDDKLIPVRSLTSGIRNRDVGLFYGESYSLVKYLIETHGAQKFRELIAEFKRNGNEDQTFQKVYGFDRDGLNREWRKSIGLKAEPGPAKSGTDDGAARASPKGTDGSTIALVIGATVALVVLAGGAVAGGLLLARRAHRGGEP
jgi:hypothetical protein